MARQGGFGTKVTIEISAVDTLIAYAREIDAFEMEKVLADITSHDSPGGWTEHIDTGKRSASEFTITLTWDSSQASHGALVDNFDDTDPVNMTFEDPDGNETIEFAAYVRSIARQGEQEEGFTAEVTIQPTGEVTINSGSS